MTSGNTGGALPDLETNPGSFRDPSGTVLRGGSRLFRSVSDSRRRQMLELLDSGFYKGNAGKKIIETNVISRSDIEKHFRVGESVGTMDFFLEHRKLTFISYPYEWPFSLLKEAALTHLDLHLEVKSPR